MLSRILQRNRYDIKTRKVRRQILTLASSYQGYSPQHPNQDSLRWQHPTKKKTRLNPRNWKSTAAKETQVVQPSRYLCSMYLPLLSVRRGKPTLLVHVDASWPFRGNYIMGPPTKIHVRVRNAKMLFAHQLQRRRLFWNVVLEDCFVILSVTNTNQDDFPYHHQFE